MATRKNTFLLKRSNVAGNVPAAGQILLGELALNTADCILYASGTTVNSILPIGWDRVSKTGDTITGNLIIEGNLTVTGDTILQSVSAKTQYIEDYLQFNTGYTGNTIVEGRMYWDSDNGNLSLGMQKGNVLQQIGLENFYYVKNQTGDILENGKVIRANGTLGSSGRILGDYMIADGSIPPKFSLGVSTESINDGEDGYVTEFGLVRGVDTTGIPFGELWTEGDVLWVSPTVLGGLTKFEPQPPNIKIEMAIVVNSDVNGSIFVRPNRYPYLNDLQEMKLSALTKGDLLMYDSDDGNFWSNTKNLFGDYSISETLTVKSISATTYQNLPLDIRVTGGTFSDNVLSLTNNIGGTFNTLINNFSGLTVNGNILSTTISATTYQNLPTDIFVTGGTYFNGDYSFFNSTGGTFVITGSSAAYNAGVITNSGNWIDNGDGSISLPDLTVALYDNENFIEPLRVYSLSSGTTGIDFSGLTNNETNYISIEYNNGNPQFIISTDNSNINGSNIIEYLTIYRLNNFLHVLEFGDEGAGLPNKLLNRFILTNRFANENGISLGVSGSTGVVTLTSGVVWNGSYRQSLDSLNSLDDIFFKNFKTGGIWTYTTTGDTFNNQFFNDGTNVVSATTGNYIVNWYYRGQEVNSHLYEVYGSSQYDSILEAQLETEPAIPELIQSHAFLVGRIIVEVGTTTGYTIESSFTKVFAPTSIASHNDLNGLQGGTTNQYYHLTLNQFNNLALTNTDNTFTGTQTFNEINSSVISATSVSAITFDGGSIFSGGTELDTIFIKPTNILTNSGLTTSINGLDVTIDYNLTGLTNNVSPATGDKLLIYDAGTNSYTNIDWSQLPGAGSDVTAQNVGTGDGLIFRDKTGTTINLRSIQSSGGTVDIVTNGNIINLEATSGGGGSTRITGSVQTTNATLTILDTIDNILDNSTSIIEVYVKAYSASAAQWGVWKRTLTVTKVSGTVTIREENADVDKTSTGLRANSLTFSVSSGNININVTGIAATTIDWNSAYEIIL
jgi:hypothetical protein